MSPTHFTRDIKTTRFNTSVTQVSRHMAVLPMDSYSTRAWSNGIYWSHMFV